MRRHLHKHPPATHTPAGTLAPALALTPTPPSPPAQESVLPPGVPVLACEALTSEGWCKYAHSVVGMRTFGASAPGKDLNKKFGFTVENVLEKARALVSFYDGKAAPNLLDRPDA